MMEKKISKHFKIMFINYNKLKKQIIITKENSEKFREQTEIERNLLKEALLYHKCVIVPLQIRKRIDGYELVDGHHRWGLLPEVIEECEDFSTEIPVIFIPLKDVEKVMLQTQLGRRNLSPQDISLYVDSLRQNGATKGNAIKQTAEDLNISVNQVKNAVYPGRAEQARLYAKSRAKQYSKNYHTNNNKSEKSLPISARNKPKTTETSFATPSTPSTSIKNTEDKIDNLEVLYRVEISEKDEEGFIYETLPNGSLYKIHPNWNDGQREYINKVKSTTDAEYKQMLLEFKKNFTRFKNNTYDFTVGKLEVLCDPIDELENIINSIELD